MFLLSRSRHVLVAQIVSKHRSNPKKNITATAISMKRPSFLSFSAVNMFLPLTVLFFSWSTLVRAGSANFGDACNYLRNRLQLGSFQFYSECNSQTYCSSTTGVCEKRGCRRDDYPFGYAIGDPAIPDKCPQGQFCPDEEDACQPLLAVGSPCQLNRDGEYLGSSRVMEIPFDGSWTDECQAPPNYKQLADPSNRGYNFNGSVCLTNICMYVPATYFTMAWHSSSSRRWANVTLGQACIVENTPYIGYGLDGSQEFINIVSRYLITTSQRTLRLVWFFTYSGNCALGMYCDSQQLICMNDIAIGSACGADKEYSHSSRIFVYIDWPIAEQVFIV
jgi:hypothetical protein